LNRANVTAHTRLSGPLALAAAIAVGIVAVLAPLPAPAAPTDACKQALDYEKTAASDSVSRQAAYDSAVAGLGANQRCADAQMKLVNEAYLLSMRAGAEHELKIGNWQRDFERANMLLTQCTNWPGLRGTKAGTDCDTQRRYNVQIAKNLNTVPTPRPAATATPPPPPSPYRTTVPLPVPASPIPSATPRR
jgi:hypothetical protein